MMTNKKTWLKYNKDRQLKQQIKRNVDKIQQKITENSARDKSHPLSFW